MIIKRTGDPAGTAAAGDAAHLVAQNHALLHTQAHDQDGADHNSLAGTAGNFIALTAGGKPVDSGSKAGDFAVSASGVTNGDSHDHVGGDGAAIVESAITLADNSTNDVGTSKHGFAPKAPNDATRFLDGSGAWTNPSGWDAVATSKYTATPASTSQLTMSDTGQIKVGLPVKYTIGGTTYYGQVDSVTSNTNITIVGATMGGDLTALWVGKPSMVQQMSLFVSGAYGNGADDNLLLNDMNSPFKWMGSKAYLVTFSGLQTSVDTGTEPKINIEINNAAVSNNDSSNGIQLGAANTWVNNSDVAINTSNYDINYGEELEVACKVAGGTGDAENLTVVCVFVSE